jgi:hypothetical protein
VHLAFLQIKGDLLLAQRLSEVFKAAGSSEKALSLLQKFRKSASKAKAKL